MSLVVGLARLTVADGVMAATLTHAGARAWGAHLGDGETSPEAEAYRANARRILGERARVERVTCRGETRQLDEFEVEP